MQEKLTNGNNFNAKSRTIKLYKAETNKNQLYETRKG